MPPVLVASNLTKVIGKRTIVDGVSFSLNRGEVFGFLGPNGAGKTTTIRMLVGLIKPTAGNVTICGFDVRRDFEKALRNVGCIVENPDLYRFMTGRENLEHFARMLSVPSSEIERVGELVSGQHEMEFRVGDVARASQIVEAKGLPFRADTDRLWISIEEADTPPLVAALAAEGIAVFHAQRHVQSLEEMFLQATGGETV